MVLFTMINNPLQFKSPQVDDDLIQQIGENVPNAFVSFYEITHKILFSYILSIVLDPHDAEDILQETYLKVRSSAHLYEPRGNPMAWIFTIAKNLSLMHLRTQKYVSGIVMDDLENHNNFSEVVDEDDRVLLETLIKELEETERTVILLHAVSGFKLIEISKNLSIPLPTVLSKYYRGLRKIRKSIQQREGVRS